MSGSRHQRSIPEMVTYAVSVAVLVLLVGGLGVLWMHGTEAPPSLVAVADLEALEQRGDGYSLPIAVTNQGDQAAQEVAVDVTLGEETWSFILALVPGGATRYGTVVLPENPTNGDLTVAVVSFIAI